MEILLTVKSSDGTNSYPVRFEFGDRGFVAACGCPAGAFGRLCKHVIGLMRGEENLLLDRSGESSLQALHEWLERSNVRSLLDELTAAEDALEAAKRRLAKAKKELENEIG